MTRALEALSAATYEVARSFLVQPEARLVARRLEILEAHHEQLVVRVAVKKRFTVDVAPVRP